jgi:hypothetical protein
MPLRKRTTDSRMQGACSAGGEFAGAHNIPGPKPPNPQSLAPNPKPPIPGPKPPIPQSLAPNPQTPLVGDRRKLGDSSRWTQLVPDEESPLAPLFEDSK